MRWRWLIVVLALAGNGCSVGVVAAPQAVGSSGPQGPATATATGKAVNWNSVTGGCPTLSGPDRERVTDEVFGQQNPIDDATSYEITCLYGKPARDPAVFLSISIDRTAEPGTDWRGKLQFAESVANSAGHLIVPLTTAGGGGLAIADRKSIGAAHPVVLAAAWSKNASVTANVRLDSPIHNDADLTAQAPALVALLNDVLDHLRP